MAETADSFDLPQIDWRYEMRRECQEVLKGIFVGPAESGKNLAYLQGLNIGAVVVLRAPNEALFLKPRFPDQLRYLVLDVHDRESQNLIGIYSVFRDFVEAARAQGQGVLVHDDGGMSRAPAMVGMYVIDKRSLRYQDAISLIQFRRYCVHINPGFVRQMKEFESLCVARDQHRANQASSSAAQLTQGEEAIIRAARRRRDDDDDGDEDTAASSTAAPANGGHRQKRGRGEDVGNDDYMTAW